jgi:hypothetical protein
MQRKETKVGDLVRMYWTSSHPQRTKRLYRVERIIIPGRLITIWKGLREVYVRSWSHS